MVGKYQKQKPFEVVKAAQEIAPLSPISVSLTQSNLKNKHERMEAHYLVYFRQWNAVMRQPVNQVKRKIKKPITGLGLIHNRISIQQKQSMQDKKGKSGQDP